MHYDSFDRETLSKEREKFIEYLLLNTSHKEIAYERTEGYKLSIKSVECLAADSNTPTPFVGALQLTLANYRAFPEDFLEHGPVDGWVLLKDLAWGFEQSELNRLINRPRLQEQKAFV